MGHFPISPQDAKQILIPLSSETMCVHVYRVLSLVTLGVVSSISVHLASYIGLPSNMRSCWSHDPTVELLVHRTVKLALRPTSGKFKMFFPIRTCKIKWKLFKKSWNNNTYLFPASVFGNSIMSTTITWNGFYTGMGHRGGRLICP